MALEDDLLALERQVIADGAAEWLAGIAELRVALAMGWPIHKLVSALVLPRIDQLTMDGRAAAYDLARRDARRIIDEGGIP